RGVAVAPFRRCCHRFEFAPDLSVGPRAAASPLPSCNPSDDVSTYSAPFLTGVGMARKAGNRQCCAALPPSPPAMPAIGREVPERYFQRAPTGRAAKRLVEGMNCTRVVASGGVRVD